MSVSAATGIIGSELQGWAALEAKNAMQRSIQQEAARQESFRQQAAGAFTPYLNTAGSEFANTALGQGAANRMQAYGNVGQAQLGLQGAYAPAPSARDLASVQAYGAPRAALGAYGDWSTQQGLGLQNSQNAINQISSFAKGDAGVFPYGLSAAQHSWDKMAAIGQAIQSMGGAAANFEQYNQIAQPQQQPLYGSPSFYGDMYNPQAVPPGGYQDWSNPGYGGGSLTSAGIE
jgi:hypothetical protein